MTTTTGPDDGRPDVARFGGVAPIFRVRDLAKSIAYYVESLGFSLDWEYPGSIAGVSRDRCSIFLTEEEQGQPVAWAWIGVGDVQLVHDELLARGARIRQGPTNFAWALEIQVEDLDRNVLRIGSSPREGAPEGPWLDMHGRLWERTLDGWRLAADADPA